jgi:GT2 family glycosyltransferase/SAM-dependent methyltransferase
MATVEEANTEQQTPARRSAVKRELKPITAALNARAEETIARLERELAAVRAQLEWGYRARDTLGSNLRSLFRSPIWKFAAPMRALARFMGKMRVGIDQLIPMTVVRRGAEGSWEGVGLAQFLIPTLPVQGWVRIKAKIRSSVSSQACLYFDTGSGFHEGERFDLSPVGGELTIDRLVPLKQTTYSVRFDALQHIGNFAVCSFSFEPISRFGANLLAVWVNARKMIRGGGAHRPSILLGLKILLTGNWRAFHRQLLSNAGGEIANSSYDLWQKLHEFSDADRLEATTTIATWKNPPLFSIILPVYDVDEIYLRQCIESVIRQIYPHWELCIADDASPQPHVRRVLDEYAAKDSRIKVTYRTENGNISAASNSALELATGQYIALLDHDDELVDRALYRMADVIIKDPSLDMVYSDEDKVAPHGALSDPFFKPDWSPDYFLSCMYTCHLGVYRTELVKKIGGFRSEFDSAQDYDLVLRLIAQNRKVFHVPDVLYHWRSIASSAASERVLKPESHLRAQRAIQQHLDAIGRKATVEDGPAAGCHLVKYEVLGRPKISIIIPSACQTIEADGQPTWMALNCVQSIRRVSTYDNVEIIVVDRMNMPEKLEKELEKLGVRRVTYDFDFNWARVNNHGAAQASGDYLLFLNDDTEPITPAWLEMMLGYVQWPEIGAVGPKLVYPDGSLQHTGVCLPGGNPTHPFYRYPGNHPGHFYSNQVPRNWSAVTGACLMTPTKLFHSLGGFDTRFPLNYNDVAYGLAVLERGLRVVYSPMSEVYHFESKTRSPEVRADEMAAIHEIWEKQYRWDPYYSPNLATDSNDFKIAPVPLHPVNVPSRLSQAEAKATRNVNQPIDREKWAATRQAFSRKYLAGDGIEIGALHQPLWTPPAAHVRYVDRFNVAGLREHYPELKDFKLVDVDVLDDGEKLGTFTAESLDFIISNHMLEHCENPIGTIRNHLCKVRSGGILYYAVPDKRKTFDIERELTSFDHLVEDDRLGPQRSRRKHFLEWSQWVNHQNGTHIEDEADRLMRQNYSIHYHVWDDDAFRHFVESARKYLDDPFVIEELVENEFETIAILRKR